MGPCQFCNHDAEVVGGLCTNCGRLRDPTKARPPQKVKFIGSFWDDLDWGWQVGLGGAVIALLGRLLLAATGAWHF